VDPFTGWVVAPLALIFCWWLFSLFTKGVAKSAETLSSSVGGKKDGALAWWIFGLLIFGILIFLGQDGW